MRRKDYRFSKNVGKQTIEVLIRKEKETPGDSWIKAVNRFATSRKTSLRKTIPLRSLKSTGKKENGLNQKGLNRTGKKQEENKARTQERVWELVKSGSPRSFRRRPCQTV